MGMSYGMMGGLAGIGKGLIEHGDFLRKQEEADAEMGRRTKMETFLMAARDEYTQKGEVRAEGYKIAGEGRATLRDIEKDRRDWDNKKTRAPEQTEMDVTAERTKGKAKLDFETENIGTITGNKKAVANASQSDADVALKDAQATFYSGRNEAAAAKVAGRLTPEDKAEMDGLNSEIRNMKSKISDAQIKGEWDDKAPTPGQMKALKDMRVMEQRRADIIARYREESPAPKADPLNRNKPAKEPAAQPGMMGPTNAGEAGMKAAVDGPMGADPAAVDREISATTADLKKVSDPASRAELEKHLADLQKAKVSIGAKPAPAAPAPAAAAQPAAPIDPAEMLGREVDSARDEFRTFTEPSKRPGLAAGASARDDYARKVESLKAKLKAAESRYQRAVGGTTAAFNVARP